MLNPSRLIVALTAFAGLCTSASAEPVLLRYKFKTGDVVRYTVQMRSDYTLQLGEKEEQPYTAQSSIKNYRVVSVDPSGNADLELMLVEQVRAEAFENNQLQKFDSTQPGEQVPTMFLPMQAMVGKPHLKLTASPTGVVNNPQPLLAQPAKDAANAAAENESANEMAMDVLVRLPQEAIEIGGTWNEEFSIPITVAGQETLKKNIRLQRQYTLKSVENGIATIDIANKILTPVTAPEEELQLIMRSSTQVVTLDLEKGLMLSREITLTKTVAGLQQGRGAISVRQKHVERYVDPSRTASKPATTTN